MTGLGRRIANLLIVLMLAIGAMAVVPGCKKEGPAEKAGKAVDKAAENVGEAAEDATK